MTGLRSAKFVRCDASIGVTIFTIKFSWSVQLKSEKLEEAHALWKDKGPKSYDMILKKRLGSENQSASLELS